MRAAPPARRRSLTPPSGSPVDRGAAQPARRVGPPGRRPACFKRLSWIGLRPTVRPSAAGGRRRPSTSRSGAPPGPWTLCSTAQTSSSSAMASGGPASAGGGASPVAQGASGANAETCDICAVEWTSSSDGDDPLLAEPLDQIRQRRAILAVTADGPTTTRAAVPPPSPRSAEAADRGRRIAKPREPATRPCARRVASIVRVSETLNWAGVQRRTKAGMRCLTAVGDHIAALEPDRQSAEIHIRAAPANRFNALGATEIVCAA